MKWYILVCMMGLAGCQTIPAKPEWPKEPDVGVCPELVDAVPSEKLSDLLTTITANYGEYHNCQARVEAWQQWYKDQEKIYNDAK